MSRGYKADCPECGGHNLYVTPDNGVEYCFNCGYRRSPEHQPAAHIPTFKVNPYIQDIRHYYTKLGAYYHACVTPAVREYLNARGITDTLIQHYGIGYCPASTNTMYEEAIGKIAGISTSNGKSVLAGRIIFPYFNPLNNMVCDLRGRAFDATDSDVKYKGPYNTASSRGADEWPYDAAWCLSADPLVVTEGEIKSLVATSAGVPTVGLPGMGMWRWRIKPAVDTERRIVVVFDAQRSPAVHESVMQAIDRIAQKLPNVYVGTLPLWGNKTDVDEFILTRGVQEFKMIVNSALPYTTWANLQRRSN